MAVKRTHTVYIVCAKDGAPLYVGATSNILNRMRNHRGSSLWFELTGYYCLLGPFNRDNALWREQLLIIRLWPRFNTKRALDIPRNWFISLPKPMRLKLITQAIQGRLSV